VCGACSRVPSEMHEFVLCWCKLRTIKVRLSRHQKAWHSDSHGTTTGRAQRFSRHQKEPGTSDSRYNSSADTTIFATSRKTWHNDSRGTIPARHQRALVQRLCGHNDVLWKVINKKGRYNDGADTTLFTTTIARTLLRLHVGLNTHRH
jgi:hypothetical protein